MHNKSVATKLAAQHVKVQLIEAGSVYLRSKNNKREAQEEAAEE